MKHLGDITKLNGAEIQPVDVITFGSPCQDLSLAGKRKGLAGERSGLFMEAIRVIKEMRNKTNGEYPKFAVWENVFGTFSSNGGDDFRAVLEELASVKQNGISIPRPDGKWAKSGGVSGHDWSLAWRTMDAQYWGVPQRRMRIALVADFTGQRAGEILFEPEGVRGYFAPGVTPWQGTARATETGTHGADGEDAAVKAFSFDSLASNSMKSANPHSGCREVDVAKTVDTSYQDPSKNQGGIAVVAPVYCIQGNIIDRSDAAGANGKGVREDVCYTLNTIDRPAVCYDARGNGNGKVVPTLTGDHNSRITDYTSIVIKQNCFSEQPYSTFKQSEQSGTLTRSGGTIGHGDETLVAEKKHYWIVRRLTPLECERLQGFPDEWTDLGEWFDSKGKRHKYADSPRYKALGNSIALPQWYYVLGGISDRLPQNATIGSLFDGIGGFPYVWSKLHKDDKTLCVWASEIEEFPIAVTKKWFPEEI